MSKTAWRNFSDFHRYSGYGKFRQEHRASQGRLPFRMLRTEQEAHEFTDPCLKETVLTLSLAVEPHCNLHWSMLGRKTHVKAEQGTMVVLPSHTESAWAVDGRRTLLVLCIPDATFRCALGQASPSRIDTTLHRISADPWFDPFVEGLLKRLWDACVYGHPYDRSLTDGLMMSILAQLLTRATGDTLGDTSFVALPEWRLKRVRQYVESHLSDKLCVDDLAEVAGLSRRHFTRSFQQQVGETPHRWLLQQRIERAQEMLKTSDSTLSQIAYACGFSSQSHFTGIFKTHTGTTPSLWRQPHKCH